MSVYPNSTRQFIQKTPNIVSIAPILIREDRSIALLFDGDTPYKFEIFHLIFIVTKSGICVKSYLADDKMIHYTNLLDLDKIKLQHVLCILTSNIGVMEANAYNDDLFTTVYNHIKKLIVQVKDRIGYESIITTPYFQIGVSNTGLVFKQADAACRVDMVIGRIMESMGTDVIALFGYLHEDVNNRIEHNTTATAKMEGCTMYQTLFQQEFNSAVKYENQDQHPYYYVKKKVLKCMDETTIRQSATMHFTP